MKNWRISNYECTHLCFSICDYQRELFFLNFLTHAQNIPQNNSPLKIRGVPPKAGRCYDVRNEELENWRISNYECTHLRFSICVYLREMYFFSLIYFLSQSSSGESECIHRPTIVNLSLSGNRLPFSSRRSFIVLNFITLKIFTSFPVRSCRKKAPAPNYKIKKAFKKLTIEHDNVRISLRCLY